jgi:hypothetical protein
LKFYARLVTWRHVLFALAACLTAAPAVAQTPFACYRLALSSAARKRHFDELSPALRELHTSIRELPDGYEFEFAPEDATFRLLAEWADGERRCCPFFDVAVRFDREGGPLWLRLTGREGVKQFIRSEFRRWFPQ